MDSTTSADRNGAGPNKLIVGLTVGLWAITFVMIAVRYVNTGHLSVFLVLVGVSCLLSLASHVARRRPVRWLLRLAGGVGIAVAAYWFFPGAR